MPTMQDIALRVGVNRTTVSNVLNGKLKAQRSDASRRAADIIRVAKQLGYRPNAAAKATSTGRTGLIGMIRSGVASYSVYSPSFDQGLAYSLHRRGLCLVTDLIDDETQDLVSIPRIVRENTVDGILVNYAFGTPPATGEMLDQCRIPAIWINRKREYNCVRPEDEGAAYEATRYLLEHGHKRIAYVLANGLNSFLDPNQHYSISARRLGYERALRHAGLQPQLEGVPKSVYFGGEYEDGESVRAFVELLRSPNRPTAVLCSDYGREMVAAAWQLNLRVPEDLSVITFENHPDTRGRMRVDRLIVPFYSMGCAAGDELCALIDAPQIQRQPVVLPFEFDLMGTVARPTV